MSPTPLKRLASKHCLTATLTVLLAAPASVGLAQEVGPGELSPELKEVRAALDKYQDPILAVHDGYLSTVGCIDYPSGGGEGAMHYAPGGMGVHLLNLQLIGPDLDPRSRRF